MSVRVLLVDDDALMRAGLRTLLGTDPDIEIVGEAADGDEAPHRVRTTQPDVVLMDVRMPRQDGISATRDVLAAFADVKVIVLTTFEEDEHVFGAIAAGASGFLLKRTSPEELIAGVKAVAAGDALLSPSVTRRVLDRVTQGPAEDATADARLALLTAREREVLELIAQGATTAEIAAAFTVEASTIKTHTKHVLAKLGVRDRLGAVIYAYEHGVVPRR